MTEKKNNQERKRRGDRKQGRGKKPSGPPKVQVEISAGGIVYKRTRTGLRIALMLDPFGKWTFPKGHVEPGETIEQAAVRETEEELRMKNLKLQQPLGIIDFWFREKYRPGHKGKLVHKFVHYYLMKAPAREWGKPQKEEKIRKIAWVRPKEALRRSSYEDVRPVLEKALIALGVKKRIPAPEKGTEAEKTVRRRKNGGKDRGKHGSKGGDGGTKPHEKKNSS